MMCDQVLLDDGRTSTEYPSNSLQPTLTLSLAPNVGSCVTLSTQQCELAFIWDDLGTDMDYIRCIMHHKLVGVVLRETETQFVVQFDIPPYCFSAMQRGLAVKRPREESVEREGARLDSPVVQAAATPFPPVAAVLANATDDKNGSIVTEGKEEEHVLILNCGATSEVSGFEEVTNQLRQSTQFLQQSLKTPSQVAPSASAAETTSVATLMGGSAMCFELSSFFGVVPVLSLTGDNVSLPTPCTRERRLRIAQDTQIPRRAEDRSAGRSLASASQQIAFPGQSLSPALICGTNNNNTNHNNRSYTTQTGASVRMSISITKRCCTSLLQSVLEIHNKLGAITTAVTRRDFVAATHILISVVQKQLETSGNLTDSLSLTNYRSTVTDETQDYFSTAADWHAILATILLRDKVRYSTLDFCPIASSNLSDAQRPATARQELAPLYALLSCMRFYDGQHQQSLRDALTGLSYDVTCIEAYTRAIISCRTLGHDREALLLTAIAPHRCVATSSQFVRLARSIHANMYYRSLCIAHDGKNGYLNVHPRVRRPQSLGELTSVHDCSRVASASTCNVLRSVHPCAFRVRQLSQSCTAVQWSLLRCVLPVSSPTMEYFSRSLRARSTCGFSRDDVVFTEEVAILLVLPREGPLIGDATRHEKETSMEKKERPLYCDYCAYPLVSLDALRTEVAQHAPKKLFNHFLKTFVSREVISCAGRCGNFYCSEMCRSRAVLEYHCVECHLPSGSAEEDGLELTHTRTENMPPDLTEALSPRSRWRGNAMSASAPLIRPSIRELVRIRRARQTWCGVFGLEPFPQANVIQKVRKVLRAFHESILALPARQMSRAVTTALLLTGRVVSSVLSLFLPVISQASVKAIIARYTARGFTPNDPHDAHGLCLAEETLQQLGVPFFADTNYTQPLTAWELPGDVALPFKQAEKGNRVLDDNAQAHLGELYAGFERVAAMLRDIDGIIQCHLCHEKVAFSDFCLPDLHLHPGKHRLAPDAGGRTSPETMCDATHPHLDGVRVWLTTGCDGYADPPQPQPHAFTWTFASLLGFLGRRRFMEQLWDFAVSSYSVLSSCAFAVDPNAFPLATHEAIAWREVCRRHTATLAVMGPLSSVVSDLAGFTGDVMLSRFFADAHAESPKNPLLMRRADSQAMSMLSINSHELEERRGSFLPNSSDRNTSTVTERHPRLSQSRTAMGGVTTANLEATVTTRRAGERGVIMRASRCIAAGEELRYEGVGIEK